MNTITFDGSAASACAIFTAFVAAGIKIDIFVFEDGNLEVGNNLDVRTYGEGEQVNITATFK